MTDTRFDISYYAEPFPVFSISAKESKIAFLLDGSLTTDSSVLITLLIPISGADSAKMLAQSVLWGSSPFIATTVSITAA